MGWIKDFWADRAQAKQIRELKDKYVEAVNAQEKEVSRLSDADYGTKLKNSKEEFRKEAA